MNAAQAAIQAFPNLSFRLCLKGGTVEITVENEKVRV